MADLSLVVYNPDTLPPYLAYRMSFSFFTVFLAQQTNIYVYYLVIIILTGWYYIDIRKTFIKLNPVKNLFGHAGLDENGLNRRVKPPGPIYVRFSWISH